MSNGRRIDGNEVGGDMLTWVDVGDDGQMKTLRRLCDRNPKEVMCIRMTYAYDALLGFISLLESVGSFFDVNPLDYRLDK